MKFFSIEIYYALKLKCVMKKQQTLISFIDSSSFIQQSKEAYESLLQTVQLLEQQITNKTRDYESQQRVCSTKERGNTLNKSISGFFFQLAEQRKNLIDEMAANHLQAEEKAKSIVQTQKEKYQNELEKFEKEIVDLKVCEHEFCFSL